MGIDRVQRGQGFRITPQADFWQRHSSGERRRTIGCPTAFGSRVLWRWPRWCCALLILAALCVQMLAAHPVRAAQVVTNGNDSGPGSLRQAIGAAASGDTITFDSGVTTVTLTSNALMLFENVTIQGTGVGGVTIQRSSAAGTPAFAVIAVAIGVTATLEGLTIANGSSLNGGGILNSGNLTVANSVVSGNRASANGGGIANTGSLALTDTTVRNNAAGSGGAGGGVANTTTMTAINLVIRDNSAYVGGGIANQGAAALARVTISGNTVSTSGGGIYNTGSLSVAVGTISGNTAEDAGGGIANLDAANLAAITISDNTAEFGGGISNSGSGTTLTVKSSTFSGNTAKAGGGIENYQSTATLTNSTFSGNTANGGSGFDGGGVRNFAGTTTLRFVTMVGNTATARGGGLYVVVVVGGSATTQVGQSLIAGNNGPQGADCAASNGPTIGSLGYNAVKSGGGCPTNGTGDVGHGDPLAGLVNPTLADNGGPTKTHALPAGSPAIDRVPNAECGPAAGKDQREFTRPVGAACDAGAVEAGASGPPTPRCAGFNDVAAADPACAAITALTAQNIIRGYSTTPPTFGPSDPVQRAQVAAFLVRALQWQNEAIGPRTFTDFGDLVAELKTASLVLANKCDPQGNCVGKGYAPADCTAKGKTAPCFGPNDQVSKAQVISFIARAFQFDADFAWAPQPNGTLPYQGVPTVHQPDVKTYHHYAGSIPDAPTTEAGWSAPASRAWIAMVLYQALQSAPK